MKIVSWVIIFASISFSETLELQSMRKCDVYVGEKNADCVDNLEKIKIERQGNSWARYWTENKTIGLSIVLDDKNMLILSQTVSFSGTRMFYINKLNFNFIISEVAYSDFGKKDFSTSITGKYSISIK